MGEMVSVEKESQECSFSCRSVSDYVNISDNWLV